MSKKCSEKLRKMLNTEWTVVLLRDGRLGVVMEDKRKGLSIFGCTKDGNVLNLNGLVSVREYDENLNVHLSDFDHINRDYEIMAIRDYCYHLPPSPTDLKKILFGVKDPSDIAWDWKREEVKEVTMSDIEEAFGCKVKIVKEKENE